MYNNSPRGRPSLSFIFSFSRSGGWLVHPPHGRAKSLPRRGQRGMRSIRGASLGPSQPCPAPKHAIPQVAARSACSLDTPSPAPPAGLELAGMRRRHQTTSALRCSCCPRPLRLILNHIPMCCAVVSCFPPPLLPTSQLFLNALWSLGKSIMKGAQSRRFSPSSSSSSHHPPSPGLASFGLRARCWESNPPQSSLLESQFSSSPSTTVPAQC